MVNFYEFYTILEGQAEDFVAQNPELQPAYSQGVKNVNYLKWLFKNKDQEPLEDIIPLVFAFEKNKIRLPIKDIFQYKNPGLLRQEIEKLGDSKTKIKDEAIRQLKDNETTKLGEFGDWIVVMPHTTESSCQWGKGTTWCTAATQSANLFLNYVRTKNDNIILYYLIKKGANSIEDPNAKISIGIKNGIPILDGKDGELTVNAQNKGLKEIDLKKVLGDQYSNIMNRLKEHSHSTKGIHPAKQKMQELANGNDPDKVISYMKGMKDKEKEDFLIAFLEYNVSTELLKKLIEKNDPPWIKKTIAIYTNNPDILTYLFDLNDDNDDKSPSAITTGSKLSLKALIAGNENTPLEIREKLSTSNEEDVKIKLMDWIRFANFKDISKENLAVIKNISDNAVKDKSAKIRRMAVDSPVLSKEQFIELTKDEDYLVRRGIIFRLIGPQIQKPITFTDEEKTIILTRFARDPNADTRLQLAQWSKLPKEVYEILAQDKEHYVREAAQRQLKGSNVAVIRLK